MMKKLTWVAVMLMAVGGVAFGVGVQAQGIDPIEARQTGLDLLAGTFAGIKAVVTTNGDVKTLEGPGKAIQRWGKLFPTLFPAGSDKGSTKASPDIWTDNATFQKDAMALSTAGGALATAAKAGDATAVNAAFKEIGDACGACHKAFRLK
jgi:cytochrome c556